uniref:Uncharacterized protein n=1 Tax=Pithovirus LCPAC001 TaxID=2506585 RepID=A0A481Z2B8_9VIRU|nr:MAG: hypothetical protein LCPAC001_00940 [Pithovirus LCPAC001]
MSGYILLNTYHKTFVLGVYDSLEDAQKDYFEFLSYNPKFDIWLKNNELRFREELETDTYHGDFKNVFLNDELIDVCEDFGFIFDVCDLGMFDPDNFSDWIELNNLFEVAINSSTKFNINIDLKKLALKYPDILMDMSPPKHIFSSIEDKIISSLELKRNVKVNRIKSLPENYKCIFGEAIGYQIEWEKSISDTTLDGFNSIDEDFLVETYKGFKNGIYTRKSKELLLGKDIMVILE